MTYALNPSLSPFDGSIAIEAPLKVSADIQWDRSCDVLVIGLGAAGAAAAIAAKNGGADVLITERFEGGGATKKSGGVIYCGGGTRQQKALGYNDTPEQMFHYLKGEVQDAVSEPTLRNFCEDSRSIIEWLESLGGNFDSTEPPPKTSYPKRGINLYYSGNESVPADAKRATPAPRGHRMDAPFFSGVPLFKSLRDEIDRLRVPVLTQSAVRRLLIDADGQVVGVEIWQLESTSVAASLHRRLIRLADSLLGDVANSLADRLRRMARDLELKFAKPVRIQTRSIVLTTGGFIFNRQMLEKHAPKYLVNMRLGTTGCDGSGIRLGQSVGGAIGFMERVSAWRFINPPMSWTKGIAVNSRGERFCNEQVYGARLGVAMMEHQQGRAWLILDRKLWWASLKEAVFGGAWSFQSIPAVVSLMLAPKKRSLRSLADRMGFPPESLERQVAAYNAGGDARTDPFGKDRTYFSPLNDSPYYAINISADSVVSPCPAITFGGLLVDEKSGAVLDAQHKAIPGLYAAGRCAVGIPSNAYVSGLSIADCLWAGKRAGMSAARK